MLRTGPGLLVLYTVRAHGASWPPGARMSALAHALRHGRRFLCLVHPSLPARTRPGTNTVQIHRWTSTRRPIDPSANLCTQRYPPTTPVSLPRAVVAMAAWRATIPSTRTLPVCTTLASTTTLWPAHACMHQCELCIAPLTYGRPQQ